MSITKSVTTIWKNEDGFEFQFEPIEDTLSIAKTKDGFEAKYLEYDEIGDNNPREWDNLGKMICFHKRYVLGDKHDLSGDSFDGWSDIEKYLYEENDIAVMLPIYMYDHSGIGISTDNSRYPFNCPWDSGRIGFIFVTKEQLRKEYSVKRVTQKIIDKARKILLAEVDEYDKYLRGDVYRCVKETYNHDKEQIDYDACCGYIGYENALECLKNDF